MDVSTFEILYKPLTPPLGAGTEAIARRVLQGYFLTIANTEAFDFTFRIAFNITLPNPDNPARRLDGNTLFITDVASPDNVFSTSLTRSPAGGNRYVGSFVVPAGKTALVVLLPNITVPTFFATTPADIEIRGWVSLSLPCLFRRVGRFFKLTPQEGAPARVLLNAEHRSTYLPPGWPVTASGDLDFDQTGTNLTLASGMALNEVPQDRCFFFPPVFEALEPVLKRIPDALVMASDLDEVEAAAALVAGLARFGPENESLDAMNRVLEQAGLGVRLAPAPKAAGQK
ncbi:hypothetical protein ABEV34_15595 [Methylorubrum rhodesianum]|jgi:hypothetical protein|uniref:DUF4331 domain-containing protein n=1 Tax=Methylorubrum rhodesianum TaxID=29427 RepID=A0ABU9ZEY9_9HYPH|nr:MULTISPECIES: hypothetical protein [Methylorubrum]MBB5762737.1 hypothetical protein [Methylorubrum rhodesianum]MBI1688968.1 hypothetical protein [Methylorubrum sp. DB1722]